MTITEKLQAIISRQRLLIPDCNKPIFDTVTDAYLPLLIQSFQTPDYDTVSEELFSKIINLQNPDAANLPPDLPRIPGEPIREYLARCYAAAAAEPSTTHQPSINQTAEEEEPSK